MNVVARGLAILLGYRVVIYIYNVISTLPLASLWMKKLLKFSSSSTSKMADV